MKKLLLCILFVLLALPALADDGSPMWKDFKARWMSVFPAGSVTVQDQGQIKICTLEEGVTAKLEELARGQREEGDQGSRSCCPQGADRAQRPYGA